jgi:hypothetical protein
MFGYICGEFVEPPDLVLGNKAASALSSYSTLLSTSGLPNIHRMTSQLTEH